MIRSIIASCFLLSSAAFADVSISWGNAAAAGIKEIGGGDAPAGWVAQLMFTRDMVPDAPNGAMPLGDVGDDQVLHTQPINNINFPGFLLHVDDGDLDPIDGKHTVAGDTLAGGFVYTRVFNVDFGSADIPTLYGVSDLSAALVPETNDPGTIAGLDPQLTVNLPIPEPSTYALMGFGAFLIFLRSRREQS